MARDGPDGESVLRRRYDTTVDDVRAVCETDDGAAVLSASLSDPAADPETVRETARAVRAAGESASAYVGAHGVAAEAAVAAAFAELGDTEAVSLAREGRDSAQEAVDLMGDVERAADTVTDDVARLQERVDEIDDIAADVEAISESAHQQRERADSVRQSIDEHTFRAAASLPASADGSEKRWGQSM